jgi:hypothetical protein
LKKKAANKTFYGYVHKGGLGLTKEELIDVGQYMRRLEEDSSVRIVFTELSTLHGLTYIGCNGKCLMIINSSLSQEAQLKTLWHEAKHIYSHLGKEGDIKIFEDEANKFTKSCTKNDPNKLIEIVRAAW